jgi:hypothetical protein
MKIMARKNLRTKEKHCLAVTVSPQIPHKLSRVLAADLCNEKSASTDLALARPWKVSALSLNQASFPSIVTESFVLTRGPDGIVYIHDENATTLDINVIFDVIQLQNKTLLHNVHFKRRRLCYNLT